MEIRCPYAYPEQSMKKPLFADIARKLVQQIKADPSMGLGSIGELAGQWNVCYATMQKAVAVLAQQDIIESHRGRRIRLPVCEPALRTTPGSRLAGQIRDAIKDGTYRVGQPLPKGDYFVQTRRVAYQTIAGAMRLLHGDGLIHKDGKRWVVGPHRQLKTALRSSAPTVLLVVPRTSDVVPFYSDQHLAPFSTHFSTELASFGIRLTVVPMYLSAAQEPDQVSGIEEAEKRTRRLGSQYQGALALMGLPEAGTDAWLEMLLSFKMPVVGFDYAGGDPIMTPKRAFRTAWYRLFFDELSAVRMAIDKLADAGHRRIGFPNLARGTIDWATRRIEMARQCAASHECHPEILTIDHAESFWNPFGQAALPPFFQRFVNALPEPASKQIPPSPATLRRHTPSLAGLLDRGITALLAANDFSAIEYHEWLAAAGIDVPKGLSLASFGNTAQSAPYPISTIDFGFSRLGYLAAHVFVGDIPVRADKNGAIAGECIWVDRGSVGRPGAR